MAKPRKPYSISTIRRRVDKKWSIAVRVRAGNKCEVCGLEDARLNAHHVIGRKVQAMGTLRWALQNGVSCCPRCHKYGATSFHVNPPVSMEWFRMNRSDDYTYILFHYTDSLEGKDAAGVREYLLWVESVMDKAIADSACNSTPAVV
jgi:hypothetical protein